MPHVTHRSVEPWTMPIVPDFEKYPQTFEPTERVLAMEALKHEVRNSPAILLILRYTEAARDLGLDTDNPAVMRRVIDGAHAAYDRETVYEDRRAGYRGMDAARRAGERHPSLVYYMLQGGLVKIGLTINLRRRYVGLHPETVLAVEPGASDVEKERHRQFAAFRSHGEWFRYEQPIRDHVNALRSRFLAEVGRSMNRWMAAAGVPRRALLAD